MTTAWVPYEDRAEAAALGATWDGRRRHHVLPAGVDATRLARWIRPHVQTFPGEDRELGGTSLYVDLVPRSSWAKNVRTCVDRVDWVRIRHAVGSRCGWRCEICGRQGSVDVHERWAFESGIQRLARLIALCKPCHTATHFLLAEVRGEGSSALLHLRRVNGWTERQAMAHIDAMVAIWEERNRFAWELDLRIVEDAGVTIVQTKA